jgi:hypothetical protein
VADPLDETQKVAPVDLYPIPTLAQHEREVRKLWTICILSATGIFVGGTATILALARAQYEIAALVGISTIGFQVIVMSYGAGFFVPAFLTSLKKLALGIRLNYKGLEFAQETTEAMRELKGDLKPVVSDLKYVAEKAKPVVDTLHCLIVQEKRLEKMSDDMTAIRARIERDTKPLKLNRRPEEETVPAGPEDRALSDQVMRAWTRFAATGDPGVATWPRYTKPDDRHAVFNAPLGTGQALRKAQCDYWIPNA